MIHPTAVIDPKAELHETVQVGPYAVIDANVRVGADSRIGPHAHLTGHTEVGANNIIHTGAALGEAPQDLKYEGEPPGCGGRSQCDSRARDAPSFQHAGGRYGDWLGNFFMAHSHVGHNAVIGNDNILPMAR